MKFSIGELNIEMSANFDRLSKFAFAYKNSFDVADLNIDIKIKDKIEVQRGCKPFGNGYIHLRNNDFTVYRVSNGKVFIAISADYDYKNAMIEITESDYPCELDVLEYLLAGEMFANKAILDRKAVILHSSTVIYKDKAIAFSAVSGTGKSTQTGLWLKNFEGTRILNDDTPMLAIKDAQPIAYGTPFAGSTGINSNESASVSAIVFLKRGLQNKARIMDKSEAFFHLLNHTRRPKYDENVARIAIDNAENLLKYTKCILFECNMQDSAATYMKDFLQL